MGAYNLFLLTWNIQEQMKKERSSDHTDAFECLGVNTIVVRFAISPFACNVPSEPEKGCT